MGVGEAGERFFVNLNTVARLLRQKIVAVADADGIDEVLVQMVDKFDNAIFERRGDAEEVKSGEMLNIFAEPYATGVGTDGNVEFGGEEDDGEVLINSGYAATIELEDIDGLGLKQLLEHDAVVDVLASGDAYVRDLAADTGVAEDVIGVGGLFHPPGGQFCELARAGDGIEDSPLLVRIDHQLVGPTDLFADDMAAAKIIRRVATDL